MTTEIAPTIPKIDMKNLLTKMFNGWILHEASYDGERYTREKVTCMIEACGGDEVEGYLIYLFDYWGNDIQGVSEHFGIKLSLNAEGKLFVEDCPIDVSPIFSPFDLDSDKSIDLPIIDELANAIDIIHDIHADYEENGKAKSDV